jgi:hypothetical protein
MRKREGGRALQSRCCVQPRNKHMQLLVVLASTRTINWIIACFHCFDIAIIKATKVYKHRSISLKTISVDEHLAQSKRMHACIASSKAVSEPADGMQPSSVPRQCSSTLRGQRAPCTKKTNFSANLHRSKISVSNYTEVDYRAHVAFYCHEPFDNQYRLVILMGI